jgi:hypothetical protein
MQMKQPSFHTMLRIFSFFLIASTILAIFPASGTIFTRDGTELDEAGLKTLLENSAPSYNESEVMFFFDKKCGACGPAHNFIEAYLEENPDNPIESIDLAEGPEKMIRFRELKTTFNREKVYIPVIYIGPVALEGTDDVMTYFKDVYSWYTT